MARKAFKLSLSLALVLFAASIAAFLYQARLGSPGQHARQPVARASEQKPTERTAQWQSALQQAKPESRHPPTPKQ